MIMEQPERRALLSLLAFGYYRPNGPSNRHGERRAGFQVARRHLWLRTNAESSANRAFGRRPGVILPDTRPNVAEVIVRPRGMAYFRAGQKVAISYRSPRGLWGKRRS